MKYSKKETLYNNLLSAIETNEQVLTSNMKTAIESISNEECTYVLLYVNKNSIVKLDGISTLLDVVSKKNDLFILVSENIIVEGTLVCVKDKLFYTIFPESQEVLVSKTLNQNKFLLN